MCVKFLIIALNMNNFFLRKLWCWKFNVRYIFVYVALLCSFLFLTESRLIVVRPESFASYPVVETHFAPWSPDFSAIDGYVQYFPNQCNFNTGNISEIPLFPIPAGYSGIHFSFLSFAFIRNIGSKASAVLQSIFSVPTVDTILKSCARNSKDENIHYSTYKSNVNDGYHSPNRELFGMVSSVGEPEINNLVNGPAPRELYLWLFDQCNNPKDVNGIINVANKKKALGLVFTDTNFTEHKGLWRHFVAPKPSMPVFSVSGQLIKEIKSKLSRDINVEVYVDQKPAMYLDCSKVVYRKWTSISLGVIWTAVAVIWYLLTNVFPCRVASNLLHRFMLTPCLLKALFHVVAFVFWDLCPEYDNDYVQYLLMLYMGLNTVFNTLFYGILLLLSKGYMVTRESFDRRKSISIALLVSLVYIITSVNQVDPVGTLGAFIVVLFILMIAMLQGINRNIHYLQVRLQYIRAAGIDGFDEAMIIKLNMFKAYKILVTTYFILQILCYCWIWFFIDLADIALAAQMILELIMYAAVFFIFRPRDRVSYFSLMQDQDNALNILPMYCTEPLINFNVASDDRSNRVAPMESSNFWYQNVSEERPVVILNPGSGEASSPVYANVAVGTPVLTSSYPTNYFQRLRTGEIETNLERSLEPGQGNNISIGRDPERSRILQGDSQHFAVAPSFSDENSISLNYGNVSSFSECHYASQTDEILHEDNFKDSKDECEKTVNCYPNIGKLTQKNNQYEPLRRHYSSDNENSK